MLAWTFAHLGGELIAFVDSDDWLELDMFEVLYTNLIVEIIIDTWLKNNNRVTVLHQDSTAVTPFVNEIKSINVSETPHCEYREIIENLTRLSCLNGKN